MSDALRRLADAGAIDALDRAFGAWVARRADAAAGLAAALASAEVGKGHVCLDLGAAAESLRAHEIAPPAQWAKTLAQTPAVAAPGGRAPLVLDGGRLYLHRYWSYETRVAEALRRLARPVDGVNFDAIAQPLRDLFPELGGDGLDRQALAAVLGVTRRLAIVSGGPGTGKTTAVLRLVALALRLEPELAVALAAPTGKAAARLGEVLGRGGLPDTVPAPQTLHRLLGYNPARQTVKFDAAKPLPYGLVVVDEASMVDLGLMARLVDALAPDARLVLVGDRDQLASVEAGAVLGDICSAASGFPAAEAEPLEALLGAPLPRAEAAPSPLSAGIALLKRNYRFGEGAIGRFADAVVVGEADAALEIAGAGGEHLKWSPIADERKLSHALAEITDAWFRPLRDANSPEEALARFDRFRLLAAERRGVFGVEGLNARVESLLGVGAVDAWYRGRPVLVTENDYELGLYNGDFGLAWPDGERMMVWVAAAGGAPRAVSPARLPAHETCYAMTVHKAQGSEFDRVAVVLPPRESAVATRELLYTAVTRAREGVEIWASGDSLHSAIERRIRRASGLAGRLA